MSPQAIRDVCAYVISFHTKKPLEKDMVGSSAFQGALGWHSVALPWIGFSTRILFHMPTYLMLGGDIGGTNTRLQLYRGPFLSGVFGFCEVARERRM